MNSHVSQRRTATAAALSKFKITPATFDDFAWASQLGRIVVRALQLFIREIRSPVPMSLRRATRGWRLGFGKTLNLVYAIDKCDPRDYVTEFQQLLFCPRINAHYDHLLNNKLLFPKLMDSIGLDRPEILAFSHKGSLRSSQGIQIRSVADWLLETLQERNQIVVKPVKGRKGRGIAFIELQEHAILINRIKAELHEATSILENPSDFVVCEFVPQADYGRTLYPLTTNTIRLLTIWNYRLSQPFVAAAAQRIGTSRSFPTDNWQAGLGGLSSHVDLDTGRLGKGASISKDWRLAWYPQHPETGSQIECLEVPGWTEICRRLTDAARELAWTPQIAWDVLVTKGGFTVIEINGSPGLAVHQVHRPLLSDRRVRDFYRFHKVIK